MGPLVPDLIGNEFNFVVALFIGIAFGFILEQAGFSTSKKLVGLFYGYDFTVLRVFFTAGITAMLGVIVLGHFGLLDLSIIYINPTFLYSAIIGGLIMGLGFVVGGFCPGTSICAAAIGKIDAMFFIAGSFIGVLIFAEGYPIFEGLYKADNWGFVRVFDSLGMSQSLFAFFLTLVAVAAFWATTLIENKVNGKSNPEFKPLKIYVALSGVAIILGLSAFILPDIRTEYLQDVEDIEYVNNYKIKYMTADELAFRLLDKDKNLQIIDMRSPKEFSEMSLPNSKSFMLETLFEKYAEKTLNISKKENVFISNEGLTAKKAAIIADKLGYKNLLILKGGLNEFKKEIIEYDSTKVVIKNYNDATKRFRLKASIQIPKMIEENKSSAIPKVKPKRVLGGC